MRFKEHNQGNGREDLQPFFMASKNSFVSWDNTKEGVRKARERYAAGTHIMVTHRDGPTQFLCSIPRKRPVAACPSFFVDVLERIAA